MKYSICFSHITCLSQKLFYNIISVFAATTNTRAKGKKIYAKKILCDFIVTMEDKRRKKDCPRENKERPIRD